MKLPAYHLSVDASSERVMEEFGAYVANMG